MTVILGPVPCQGCRRLVTYEHSLTSRYEGLAAIWRDPDGSSHWCRPVLRWVEPHCPKRLCIRPWDHVGQHYRRRRERAA